MRKVSLRDLAEAMPLRAHTCSTYRMPTLMGQQVVHAQFVNPWTRLVMFRSLRWWPTGKLDGDPEPSRANAHACNVTAEGVGLLISSAEANYTWLCAPPEMNPHVGCPCCWNAPPAYSRRADVVRKCKVWNPRW